MTPAEKDRFRTPAGEDQYWAQRWDDPAEESRYWAKETLHWAQKHADAAVRLSYVALGIATVGILLSVIAILKFNS